ncbi:DMT family transporter [uncultured Lacinutrix sp.]|uniref:DMT family transporter n=1 Tax=uncultured Lacinutrix sp. TaxID=574032 RepID=UPI00260E2232|nr:DMT family transporter [uncultured Lacinutrix sp.]
MKSSHLQHVFLLTLATLFISTSGALGKYINMPSEVIVWWRSALACLFLFIYCRLKKIDLVFKYKKDGVTFILSAIFMAAHWITYFYSLKLSNVALGMLSLYTFPIMIAILEPFFVKSKLDYIHILLGLMVMVGIYILSPEFNIENSNVKGILFGLLSALCYALRTLILKQHISNYNGTMLMLHQLLIITILLSPILYLMDTSGIKTQYPYVLLLALLTTAIGHTLFIKSLSYFRVSTASIISSIQPIFGIIIAFIFLNEIPTINTFFGGLLILATVIIESIRSQKD